VGGKVEQTNATGSGRAFFSSLYDLSFREFVTPHMVRIIYIIALVAAGLWCLGMLLGGFSTLAIASQMQNSPFGGSNSGGLVLLGLAQLVGAPILFVVFSIVARMQLEIVMAIFRIAENTTAMLRNEPTQHEI
jgi:uncharacterized protein DUF4282